MKPKNYCGGNLLRYVFSHRGVGKWLGILLVSLLATVGLAAQDAAADPALAVDAVEATADAPADAAPDPVIADRVPDEGTKLWGGAWYAASARDKLNFASISDWKFGQQAGVSFNLRSTSGLEILSDLSVQLDTITSNSLDTVIQQLSIRFAPSDWLSVVVGKQRLKWGTGKIFSAIDKGESRNNPLDQRSVLSGLTGIKAEILPLDWLGFSVLVMPETDLRWSQGALRADVTIADIGLDIGVGVIKYNYSPWSTPVSRSSGGVVGISGPTVEQLDRAAIIGDLAWGAGDVTLYGEAELRFGVESGYWIPGMKAAEDFGANSRNQVVFRGLAGVLWQFDLGLTRPITLVAEYFYNGDGLTRDEARNFRSSYISWQDNPLSKAASSPPMLLPPAFAGIGNFRQHYASLALNGIALDRYVQADASTIVGLDSGLVMIHAGLGVEFLKGTSLNLGWDGWLNAADPADQPTELVMMAYRNRISLSVSTGF